MTIYYKRLSRNPWPPRHASYAQRRSHNAPIFYDADGLHVAIVDYLKQKEKEYNVYDSLIS